MAIAASTEAAGGATPPASVKVWDPFVRVFHWSLVAAFFAALATGDEFERAHVMLGYAILALVAARVVWGFVGPRRARFADFVRSPSETAAFLRETIRLRAPRHLGHNPAGGAMILALIVMLTASGATGWLLTTDRFWQSEAIEGLHEAAAYGTLGLVALHVLGVVVASLEHSENLVLSMITGRKRPSADA